MGTFTAWVRARKPLATGAAIAVLAGRADRPGGARIRAIRSPTPTSACEDVWVTNAEDLLAGRLNRQIEELDAAVSTASNESRRVPARRRRVPLRSGCRVDRAHRSVVHDARRAHRRPARVAGRVRRRRHRAILSPKGELWTVSAAEQLAFDWRDTDPVAELGGDGRVAVSAKGTRARDGRRRRTPASPRARRRETGREPRCRSSASTNSRAVGGRAVVYDGDANTVIVDERTIELPDDGLDSSSRAPTTMRRTWRRHPACSKCPPRRRRRARDPERCRGDRRAPRPRSPRRSGSTDACTARGPRPVATSPHATAASPPSSTSSSPRRADASSSASTATSIVLEQPRERQLLAAVDSEPAPGRQLGRGHAARGRAKRRKARRRAPSRPSRTRSPSAPTRTARPSPATTTTACVPSARPSSRCSRTTPTPTATCSPSRERPTCRMPRAGSSSSTAAGRFQFCPRPGAAGTVSVPVHRRRRPWRRGRGIRQRQDRAGVARTRHPPRSVPARSASSRASRSRTTCWPTGTTPTATTSTS